jgi:hypothetical protein
MSHASHECEPMAGSLFGNSISQYLCRVVCPEDGKQSDLDTASLVKSRALGGQGNGAVEVHGLHDRNPPSTVEGPTSPTLVRSNTGIPGSMKTEPFSSKNAPQAAMASRSVVSENSLSATARMGASAACCVKR